MGQNLTVGTPGGDSSWDLERCFRVNQRGLLRSGDGQCLPSNSPA